MQDRFWGSVFVKKIAKNARSFFALLCQKSLFEQLLCAPFLSPKLVAKIARRQAPVLLCEIRMQQPGYLKAPSYSVFAATLPLLLLRGHVTAQRVQCGWDALSCGKTCSRNSREGTAARPRAATTARRSPGRAAGCSARGVASSRQQARRPGTDPRRARGPRPGTLPLVLGKNDVQLAYRAFAYKFFHVMIGKTKHVPFS